MENLLQNKMTDYREYQRLIVLMETDFSPFASTISSSAFEGVRSRSKQNLIIARISSELFILLYNTLGNKLKNKIKKKKTKKEK